MFFSRSDFDFESILLFGKDLHLGFVCAQGGGRGKPSLSMSYTRWVGLSDVGLSMGTMSQGARGAA
jgi:hypothetical protein